MAGMVAGSDGQSDSPNPMARRGGAGGISLAALFDTLEVSKLPSLDGSQQRTLSGLGERKMHPGSLLSDFHPNLPLSSQLVDFPPNLFVRWISWTNTSQSGC